MRKWMFVMLVVFLLIPTVAWAEENPELISPAPTEGVTVETTTQPETMSTVEPTSTPVFSIEIFGYTIAVSEIDGVTTVALLKENEDGSFESLAVYDFSGALGRTVSTVAHLVAPGPAHGKVVSSFVRAVNEQRREQKREEIQQRKEERKTVYSENEEEKELRKGEKGEDHSEKNEAEVKGKDKNQNDNIEGELEENDDDDQGGVLEDSRGDHNRQGEGLDD